MIKFHNSAWNLSEKRLLKEVNAKQVYTIYDIPMSPRCGFVHFPRIFFYPNFTTS